MNSIKTILDFPTELIITIFTHLSPRHRLVASECCKRFLEISLSDVFINDIRVVFDKCVLDPKRDPWLTFTKSQRSYRQLIFREVMMKGELEFPMTIAASVSTVELIGPFDETSFNYVSFLSQFPNLKILKVTDIDLLDDYCKALRTAELLMRSGKLSNWVDKLNKNNLVKQSNSIRIELDAQVSVEKIRNFSDFLRNKIQGLSFVIDEDITEIKLPRLENLKYLKIYFDKGCEFTTEDIPNNLEEQFPALEDLSLFTHEGLPRKNWPCLKKLEASYIDVEQMPRISVFDNLKELTLRSDSEESCFFVHSEFLNENLKKLSINCQNQENTCFTCLQTMIKSFPELKYFTCWIKVSNNHLDELATNTLKLKCLNLNEMDSSVSFERFPYLSELTIKSDCQDDTYMIQTWPFMLRLRKLHVKLNFLNYETVKVFQKLPSLEDLTIESNDIDRNYLPLFEAMAKSLKWLKNFEFHCRRVNAADSPKIIDLMAKHCSYLQHVTLPEDLRGQHLVWKELLQKHSSLKSINSKWHFIRQSRRQSVSPIDIHFR